MKDELLELSQNCLAFLVVLSFYEPGAPVAKWLKRSPTDLAVPSSSPARGGNLSNRKQGSIAYFVVILPSSIYITEILFERT